MDETQIRDKEESGSEKELVRKIRDEGKADINI